MKDTQKCVCAGCSKEMPAEGLTFCPYCGAALCADKAEERIPEAIRRYLIRADRESDLRKRKQILLAAREEFPDTLEIEQELLFIGTPRPRKREVDFFIIKCYLLQLFLTTERFSTEEKQELITELFEGEQLKKCMELSPNGEAFYRDYLRRICCDFVEIFLKGDARYSRTLFGFHLDRRPERATAVPAATVLKNIRGEGLLTEERKNLLYNTFYAAFSTKMDGKTNYLDELLE